MPWKPNVSRTEEIQQALGGPQLLDYELGDAHDLEPVLRRGLSREQFEQALGVLELTISEVAWALEIPRGDLFYRKRPNYRAGPCILPGEQTRRFLGLVTIHATMARFRCCTGGSAWGIANDVMREAHPRIRIRGLEAVRTPETLRDFLEHLWLNKWVVNPDRVMYEGLADWYPRRPEPWQRKRRDRVPERNGRPLKIVRERFKELMARANSGAGPEPA